MGKERESRDARANRKRMPRADRDVAAAEVRASVCVCVCVCVFLELFSPALQAMQLPLDCREKGKTQ